MHTFLLVLTTLLSYFGLRLGSRIEVPKELKVPWGDLDIHYNSSSFLESYEKKGDIDIDPFGDHDKTDSHPDETGENIPLSPEESMGGESFWEPEQKTRNIIWRKNES